MSDFANIKVIGVGGGGNNAVNRMVESELKGFNSYPLTLKAKYLNCPRLM